MQKIIPKIVEMTQLLASVPADSGQGRPRGNAAAMA